MSGRFARNVTELNMLMANLALNQYHLSRDWRREMKWVSLDPECGPYVDFDQQCAAEFAKEFPEQYCLVPEWVALILRLTERVHSFAQGLTRKYKREA